MFTNNDHIVEDDLNNIFNKTKNLWPEVKNKNIFLSGGTGFFGTWILKAFIKANVNLNLNSNIYVLTRNPENHQKMHPTLHEYDSIKFIKGDIRKFDFLDINFDFIIHGATTNAHETFNKQDPLLKYDTIVNGTKRILDFAYKCKCKKFLLISSGSCYGNVPEQLSKIDENYNGSPITVDQNFDFSVLGEAKRMSEMLSNIYSNKFGIETKIARCFSFVGPYMPLDIHYAIGNFLLDASLGRIINIKGNGKQVRSYMYISDLIIWLFNILFNGQKNSIYNVGSEERITIYDLAKKISTLSSKNIDIKILNQNINSLQNLYIPSTKKINNELNLGQEINLETAIKKTYNHINLNKNFYYI